MRNKYLKRSKISEAKFREITKLFAMEIPAVQISQYSGINRNTVNKILKLLRIRIAEFCEKESCFDLGEVEMDESYFGARRIRGKRGKRILW